MLRNISLGSKMTDTSRYDDDYYYYDYNDVNGEHDDDYCYYYFIIITMINPLRSIFAE